MPLFLLISAAVIFACIMLNRLAGKLGIPTLLAFILLGMLFGSDGVFKVSFDNYAFAEQVCSVALVFIMFYGGFGTSWRAARPVAVQAIVLSSLGVVLTAALVGVFCHYVMGFSWLEGLLVGSVIGSTDAASVFSILRSKRLNLKYNTASLLEVESGSNDPFAYMLTAIVLSAMGGNLNGGALLYLIFSQLVYGVGLGLAFAAASVWLMKRVRLSSPGLDGACVIAIALLAYAAPAAIGGNGYLSVYIVGVALGNADIRHKKTLVPFFDGVTSLMQMLLFFLLGLLCFPSKLPQVALPALAIALFLTLVARPAAVFALLMPFHAKLKQMLLTSWAGLRGAASIVFAIMAVMAATLQNDLFHIVFCVVLFSILLQGSLLPFFARKLSMIGAEEDVMKTFSDYTEEIPVQFIQFTVPESHAWNGKAVRELTLPPGTLMALVRRGTDSIVPSGDTVLMCGDVVVLCAKSHENVEGVQLMEQVIERGSDEEGKTLSQLPREGDALVIMILRGEQIVIPNGDTALCAGDVMVINRAQA